jgi:serine/threonine protein phosphatase PrpC
LSKAERKVADATLEAANFTPTSDGKSAVRKFREAAPQALAQSGGQCTAAVVEISEGRVFGASVGDSGAWMLTGKAIIDLTESQHRKPLLGSDEVLPMGFGPIELSGRLLIATDGLFKYATGSDIANRAMGVSVNEAVEQLIAGVRLRSGALQDDVGIILLEATGNRRDEAGRRKS